MKSKKNSKRENRWLKCRQQIRRTGILLMGMLLVSTSAYASEPIIVTGTRHCLRGLQVYARVLCRHLPYIRDQWQFISI